MSEDKEKAQLRNLIARMAGNIAGHLVPDESDDGTHQAVARGAVQIALLILEEIDIQDR